MNNEYKRGDEVISLNELMRADGGRDITVFTVEEMKPGIVITKCKKEFDVSRLINFGVIKELVAANNPIMQDDKETIDLSKFKIVNVYLKKHDFTSKAVKVKHGDDDLGYLAIEPGSFHESANVVVQLPVRPFKNIKEFVNSDFYGERFQLDGFDSPEYIVASINDCGLIVYDDDESHSQFLSWAELTVRVTCKGRPVGVSDSSQYAN